MNDDPIIGRRRFTDGAERDVYHDNEGQYFLDDGDKVRGVLILRMRPPPVAINHRTILFLWATSKNLRRRETMKEASVNRITWN